jgi:acyl-CoA thioesterase YciA
MEAHLMERNSEATVRVLAMPKDTNGLGDIFGGWLMSQVDIAGAVLAQRRAAGRVVTVAVNEFAFLQPVYVGDVVACYTELQRVGRTSITVQVEVFSERQSGAESVKVATAVLTYVAIDDARQPRMVPPA